MAAYTTSTDICNKALQELGCAQIPNLNIGVSRNADQCAFLYDKVRLTLLRERAWLFSIKYANLVQIGSQSFQDGEGRVVFALPSDYARLADQMPRGPALTAQTTTGGVKYSDYQIEGGNLLTSQTSVILRYASNVTNVAAFDPLFCDVVAARMCVDGLAEILTQSPVKRQLAERRYMARMLTALQTNLIESAGDEDLEQFLQTARILGMEPTPAQQPQQQGRQQQ